MIYIKKALQSCLIICFTLLLNACDKPGSNCVCIAVYEPVCGADGITYSNSCRAYCAKKQEYTNGKCQKDNLAPAKI